MENFVWSVRIYYEDTDSGGVVYYANYLKYMERARTEWLRSKGFEQDDLLHHQGLMFAVRALHVDYHRPARFNDLLDVVSQVLEVRGASLLFAQSIWRNGVEKPLCSAQVKVACIDAKTLHVRRMPQQLIREIVVGH
ncbi:MAG: tol-pal system-associated acyl-CoA thioesterase [Candidatus Contendobacter odensis]|uniref:Tol-pal system-associated acyl-CoA thioesterase n=1 Tax=Candidatus Contendibacter odensensis TaxID=1400860 RepID=A0A2G6PEX7_9GAMM|nr:MAG: tol-pal system-associated acyl-CoA thioesterase [Candidatus Contendobacter odensis]